MTHPITPRETIEYWLDLALTAGANRQDFNMSEAVSGILTALASGSGDHAELAGLAGALRTIARRANRRGRRPSEAVTLTKAADALEAILAENAAMRAERTFQIEQKEGAEDALFNALSRATEAERKLAEAVGVVEWYGENARLARLIHSEGDAGRNALADDGGKRARTFLSKEAERG